MVRTLRALAVVATATACLIGVLAAVAPERRIASTIVIAAPPGRVWTVLTDLPAYPSWNPMITMLTGRLVRGAPIENVEGSGASRTVFWPRVLVVEPDRELEWRGRLWGLPLLFIGKHEFRLDRIEGGTRFVQSETFDGVLLWWFDVGTLLPGFRAMNRALADRVLARAD